MTTAEVAAQSYRQQAARLRYDAFTARLTRRPLAARRIEQYARMVERAADWELRPERAQT